jgi:hypothetical protein
MPKPNFVRVTGAALLALIIPLTGLAPANAATPEETQACKVQTQPVFQTINPTTDVSLLTRNASEVKLIASQGFTEDKGTAFKASSRLVTGLVPVYRMVKNNKFVWIPKLDTVGEYESAKKAGYTAKYVEFYASTKKLDCSVPVYRALKGEVHRFTASEAELTSLTSNGWVSEGARFYVTPATPVSTTPTPVPTPAPTAPTPAPTPPVTTVPTPAPTENPNSVVSVVPVKNLTAKTSYTAARITWDTPAITGVLLKYSATATGNGYNRTFYTKANEVVFTGLESGSTYNFKVNVEVSSVDGSKKANANADVNAITPKAPVVVTPAPTVPPVVITPTPIPTKPVEVPETPEPTTPPVVVTPTPEPTTPPVVVPPVVTPPAADPVDWVRWENIAKPGDNLNTVLQNPALAGKILKLPEGVFEVSDFRNVSFAMNIPGNVKGLIGSGNNTILRIKANTSTFGPTVPTQAQGGTNQLYILRMNNGLQKQILSDVWIQGTEQGHLYNGVMVGKGQAGTEVKNVLITGIPGDAGSPPGETFGLNWWQLSGGITRDIEVDGYRWTGDTYAERVKGAKVGSSPIGWNNADNAKLYNAYTHDSKTGMPTFWQSNNGETWNLQSIGNAAGINHEESFGIVHHEPVIYGSANKNHISYMSQRGDGNLTVIGATTDTWTGVGVAPGPIGKGKKMLVLTPYNYGTAGNKIVTKPTIVLDDGVTPQAYVWAH